MAFLKETKIKLFLCVFLVIFYCIELSSETRLTLDQIFKEVYESQPFPAHKAKDLLLYAIQKDSNIFDLITEITPYLKARGLRLTILGDDLRKATKNIRLGDDIVRTLIPLTKILTMSLGAKKESQYELEIQLTQEHSQLTELAHIYLERNYGFQEIHPKKLEGAKGISFKFGWFFFFSLSYIERIPDPNEEGYPHFIAIYLDNFPRPKRLRIAPMRFYSLKEMKEKTKKAN